MKIRSLTLKNIGVFEDETISFPEKQDKNMAEIHILTGQNGTGKTTILQALANRMLKVQPFKDFRSILSSNKLQRTFLKRLRHENCQGYHGKIICDNEEEIELKDLEIISIERIESYEDENLKETISQRIAEVKKITLNEYNSNYSHHFSAFAYSGYRFIEHQENINIKEKENYNPLENALEFHKTNDANDYSLNEWLANKMAQRNSAFFEGNKAEVEKYSRGIETLKQIIEDIIEIPIDFKFKNEKLKVVAVKQGQELDFDLLPDGLRSIISWLGDLIMRMDALKWKDDLPIFEREFILFLDEIEVHLHPSWQRKILPVVQKLFKNAQIFITTHSPFIVNSVDGAWIHKIELTDKGVRIHPATISENGNSISYVLRETFGIKEEFGLEVNNDLEKFYQFRDKLLAGNLNGSENKFIELSKSLAVQSLELNTIIQFELRQINKILNTNYIL